MPSVSPEEIDLYWLVAAAVIGYLLGSIPFGLIITRFAGLGDVRKIGSGNIGATNVLRTGNKKLAAATLACDALKGTCAVLIFLPISLSAALVAGFCAFLGHLFPIWLNFKGGKGVATYLGVLIAICWPGSIVFAVVWLLTAYITRYSSLAALVAAVAVPLSALLFAPKATIITLALMSIIIIIKHHANISRLLSGKESRIGSKVK